MYLSVAVLIAIAASRPGFFRTYVGGSDAGDTRRHPHADMCGAARHHVMGRSSSVALPPARNAPRRGHDGRGPGAPGIRTVSSPAGWHSGAADRGTVLLLFLGAIGCFTRMVIPLSALAHFVLLGILIDYSFFWHQNLVPLYLLAVLSFTPCGDGWSVDRLWKLSRGRDVPEGPPPFTAGRDTSAGS